MNRTPWLCLVSALFVACPMDPSLPCDGGVCPGDASVSGCGPGTFQTATGECRAVGATACAEGFERDPSGWGCRAVLSTCDAGAIGLPGEGCTPVGWTNCPAGFTSDGWSCQPTLPATACTGATRASIGSTSCVPIGDCSAAFPPSSATYFVDAALDGGDATHFKTISAALAAAPAGATIAVSPGTYREALTPTKAVKLIGRCPAQVQLIGSPALFADGVTGVEVEGVTVRESLLAVRVERGGQLTLRHAVLEANQRSAVQTVDPNSRVTLEDVVVRDTQADPATQTFGQGVAASFGAQLVLTDVEVTGNRETGIFLDRDATRATVTRTVVSKTLVRASTGRFGWGVVVQRGASLDADRLVVEDSKTAGIVVTVAPSAARLTDTFVRRVEPGVDNAGTTNALGVGALQGAQLTFAGGGVETSSGALIHAQDPNTSVTLARVTARGVRKVTGLRPSGIDVQDSARMSIDHVAVKDIEGGGVLALDQGNLTIDGLGIFDVELGVRSEKARVTGVALEVRRHSQLGLMAIDSAVLSISRCVVADGSTDDGSGAGASRLGVLELSRCLVSRSVQVGVLASMADAMVMVTDSVIELTALDSRGEFGQGVIVQSGSLGTFTNVTVAQNHSAGLQLADFGSELTATHVTVRGTLPNGTGTRGRGANANFGGLLALDDSAFIDNQQVGLFTLLSEVRATNCFVSGTRADPDGAYGNGIESLTDGRIDFRGGAIEGSAGIAAVFAQGAGFLDGARVAKNNIGLHVQDDSKVEELASVPATLGPRQVVVTTSTVFEENKAKLSAVTVPVPPP